MIDRLKPYPEYQASGVCWLGRIPAHWAVRRMKYVLREKDARSTEGKEQLLRVSQYTGVTQRLRTDGSDGPDTRAESLVGYKRVQPDELVVNIMLAWNGSLGVSRYTGIVSPAYCVYRFGSGVHPWYFHYLLKTPLFKGRIKSVSTGVVESRLRLYSDDLYCLEALLPSSNEQAAIVKFLDHATRRLNRAIRTKQKVIALLSEQKEVIIHRTVTRGLDPDVDLKPSGILWLGDIPRHWRMVSLRMRYSVELGKMLDGKRITGRNSVPYLRNRDVQWDRILVDDLPVMDISVEEYPRYTVKREDMLVCEGGQVGRSAFWDEQLPICGFQKALHRVRAKDPNSDYPRFLFYLMNIAATRGAFAADGNENTFAHLTCEKLRRHRFPFAPYIEQRNIANFLDVELRHCQITIDHIKGQITLLQELRTRLIADVVTGKLDVREAARHLPDDTDEAEPYKEEIDTIEEEFQESETMGEAYG
ncbi:MAG: restriction endonuclease subunit S [Deltaproteobacteria bacterium]|nr:restriction endonuclease subunit S [Deltaproteobacteria bacterium]